MNYRVKAPMADQNYRKQECQGLKDCLNTPPKIQIRHSKSDPVINKCSTNGCKLLLEKSPCDETDSALLYPHWSSSSSILSVESTISTEDLIHEMVTIEGLRSLYTTCFECGVSWHQNHVSLDCRECGGYAMSRPCPECDGKCDSQWQRNLTASHDGHRAIWTGQCNAAAADTSTTPTNRAKLIATLKV